MAPSDVVSTSRIGPVPGKDELLFLPLGGTGEIGMNLNLYGHAGKWLMIDCGVTFGDDNAPGVEVIMPDPDFIERRRDSLVALLLTHAHEDHLGAVPYLWKRLRCPVYATPFTATVLRKKLEEAGLLGEVPLTVIGMSERFEIAPFDLQLITLTHSIPEPNAVVLRTPLGTVLHTGDWKLDPDPLIGDTTDEAALKQLGEDGVLAMIGDSTNALVEGASGSEAEVRDSLLALVGEFKTRVTVACFASNIARVQTIAEVAAAHGRSVVLAGRSLWRITEAARATGYLADIAPFVPEKEAAALPRDKILLISTGSQGEPRAALPRIARDDHPHIKLVENDVVIFSSRIIPGNEVSIGRLQNQLASMGVKVITERDHFVHVSGHPARDELIHMYQWVQPSIAVPVHGEARHLYGHAELARACQVPFTPIIANGDVLRLSPDGPEIVAQVHTGRLAVDGTELIAIEDETLRSRNRMLRNGFAILTLAVDQSGRVLDEPQLSAPGILGDSDSDFDLADDIIDDVLEMISGLPPAQRRDDEALSEQARRVVRRGFRDRRGKNPPTEVHLVRLS
ncbi:MAG: ribonuclease J [Alphaproteobacteria bacterium]|nr:ribonuclease J [Alphaproteobacteria bacterium]